MTASTTAHSTARAPARVSAEHLRALTGRGERSVLIADRRRQLRVTTPGQAADACLAGTARLLATRGDLLDADLRHSPAAGRLVGPAAEAPTSTPPSRALREHRPARPGPAEHRPQIPYGGDGERDRQVRARLAELTKGTGTSVEEVLRQPALQGDTALPATVEGAARVVRRRPGDEQWEVESRTSGGRIAAQPRPCSGEKVCPWRLDAPTGQFPAAVYEQLCPGNRTAGPRGAFGCHSSGPARTLLCAGWLLAGADGNLAVLAMMDSGALPRLELPADVALYPSYELVTRSW
ncbi:DUF6283 family protein [Kitasatospora fiedleri]|uniref:DUF6283 family protein n=1 Tax=Kitasatospora fiedleri TaxID=2991545 RepID=UPI00249A2D1A|nr:DUF6283 family protein [Kitasatospora fiedleri]